MGVPCVIGYGAAGSLDSSLPHGTQLVVTSALPTDGTSAHYGVGPFTPDQALRELVPSAVGVTAATVDAVYRETTEYVDSLRSAGAQVVNMEAAPFYAAAQTCGLKAVWIGLVSDVLDGDWRDWYVDQRGMNSAAIENCLAVIANMD